MLYIPENYLSIYTTDNQAKQINNIILKYCSSNSIITDATAGIGGNSIYFCKTFKFVNCIENNYDTFNILKSNLNDYKNNILYTCSFMYIIQLLKQDIIFIDPPWGGNDYKLKKKMNLFIDNVDIIDIINKLYHNTRFICLKVPNNFNITNDINLFWEYKIHNIYKNKKNIYKIIIFYKSI